MKKIFNIILAILLIASQFALAYPTENDGNGGTSDYLNIILRPSSTTVNKDASFTITVEATSSQGIEKVVSLTQPSESTSSRMCSYAKTCSPVYTFKESSTGTKTYTFKVYGYVVKEQSIQIQIVNDGGSGPAPTGPSLAVEYPSEVQKGTTFEIKANSYVTTSTTMQRLELRRGNTLIATRLCDAATYCNRQFQVTENEAGSRVYIVKALDNNNQFTEKSVTVLVKDTPVAPDTTKPTVTVTSSNSRPTKGSSFDIIITSEDDRQLASVTVLQDNVPSNSDSLSQCSSQRKCENVRLTKTLNTVGTYEFWVYAVDSSGNQEVKKTSVTVIDSTSTSGVPDISISPESRTIKVGESVEFTIAASDSNNLREVSINSKGQTTTFTDCSNKASCTIKYTERFDQKGGFIITAKAVDTTGQERSVSSSITVEEAGGTTNPTPPSASTTSSGSAREGARIAFKVDPEEKYVGERIIFNATNTQILNPTINISKYTWDFNGDDIDDIETTSPIVTYVYNEAGDYKVRLFVTDSTGFSTYTYRTIKIKCCLEKPSVNEIVTGVFKVTVEDKNGNPIKDAVVTLTSNESVYGRNTDSNGLMIMNVAPGCYTIKVEKKGYKFSEIKNVCVKSSEEKSVDVNESGFTSSIKNFFDDFKNSLIQKKTWFVITPIIILFIVALIALIYYLTDPLKLEENYNFERYDIEP